MTTPPRLELLRLGLYTPTVADTRDAYDQRNVYNYDVNDDSADDANHSNQNDNNSDNEDAKRNNHDDNNNADYRIIDHAVFWNGIVVGM